ncbi:hypothetical protein BABINDRAFT_160054 [Babjeviella inositovora NRRL Y-12698]|uniref:1-phosphatidylinositol-4-phosphate 5-kinase n=1 Tax=Babjeviella inositovora NRRL Y-12698 TaxID=984486 RepID=A0A1E3QXQ5_9ASCO|nr:uncharacterized protein BABINDRAFT_160054 [Babjeviella inositovora NRRL Y-12698]ODQ81817.1 hypothetical protein BABINDRAFT_160054 [Babjeviella inositovora NRRL Y-12698]
MMLTQSLQPYDALSNGHTHTTNDPLLAPRKSRQELTEDGFTTRLSSMESKHKYLATPTSHQTTDATSETHTSPSSLEEDDRSPVTDAYPAKLGYADRRSLEPKTAGSNVTQATITQDNSMDTELSQQETVSNLPASAPVQAHSLEHSSPTITGEHINPVVKSKLISPTIAGEPYNPNIEDGEQMSETIQAPAPKHPYKALSSKEFRFGSSPSVNRRSSYERPTSPHSPHIGQDTGPSAVSHKPVLARTSSTFGRTSTNRLEMRRSESAAKIEIDRMRNSVLQKKPAKKWQGRRLTVDDDKVLVGNKVSEGHANYVMAYNMLTGIRVAVSGCSKAMKPLVDADFSTTRKLAFDITGTELTPSSKYDFKFKDYAPNVFRELRTLFGLDPADYLVSLTEKYILSELGSPGKSGSFFYYSRDYRFIIKTIHHSEHKQLLRILPEYHRHVKANPNTLISQFYGLHRVKMPFGKNGVRKVHFIVMNNLFPPHRDIHRTYDLKGSLMGRYTNMNNLDPADKKATVILKDLNWLENHNDSIKFGPTKRKLFLDQLQKDVSLLKKLNIMDYSLLLGVHDVAIGNTDELTNQRLSVFQPKATDKKSVINTNPESIDRMNDLPTEEFPGRSRFLFYGDDGGIRSSNEEDLPMDEIYYLGVIDCLTRYGFVKRMETFWRSLSHDRKVVSAIPSSEYGDRFYAFMKNCLSTNKKKME